MAVAVEPSQHGDGIAERAGGADDWGRRKYISEHIGLTLGQPVEDHPLMEMDAMIHDEVLMTGMEHFRIDRRHPVDREIIGADDADLFVGQPTRAFEAEAGSAVVKCGGIGMPAAAVTGPNER